MLLFVRCVTMENAMPQISRTALALRGTNVSVSERCSVLSSSLFRDVPVAAFWNLARRR
jgi:hypothetical protein